MHNSEKIKKTIYNVSKRAGEIQLENFNQQIKVIEKESASNILTEVDLKCNHLIVQFIKDNFPDNNVISEENGFEERHSKYTWVVDPLDGTSNYAAGIPWFGILIALFKNNQPIAGGAYLPVTNDFFYVEKDVGAFKNNQIISIHPHKMKDSLVAFSTDISKDEEYLKKGLAIYKFLVQNSRNTRSTNSLLDLLYVAEGKFGGCVNLFTKIWDISVPYLLIKEAGGEFYNLDFSSVQFDLSSHSINKNYGIITGNQNFITKTKSHSKTIERLFF